ncbi:hypothetical protein EON65_13005 [archaeon]|nr:MAG: hypothetical protein EON65_13005 [archaeon]
MGLGHTQSKVFQCTVVNGLRDKIVMMVSAGCYHSVTVTVNGMLYVFGRNNHGQLATGDSEERHTPHPVDDFVGQQVLKVAAGFYHTIVLTTDSKQLKKDSQSYIKPMLLAEDNCESDLPLLDAKQLAENFSKDLCLLAGPEEVDLNAAHNSRNVLNPSLSELGKTMQDSLTQVSGASSSSVRPAKYNMTCRDLLTLFIRNMLCFSKRSKESMFDTVDDRSALNGLTAYCSSLSIMLILAWEYAKGASQGINLPISADDSMNMLYNSILMTQRTLRRHRNTFMKLLGFWKEDGENFSDLVAVLQAEQPLPDLHITDFIASNFSKAFISIDTTTVGDDVSELKKSLIQEFAKIRTILATMYSASVTIPKFRDESDCLTSALSRCLIHTSEICFGDPCSLAVLVSSVSSRITQNSSTDMKEDLVGPRIRLLSALGSTLQQTEDVILLFRKAPVAGIQIYKDFLHIYMFFSSITLDRRLQGHASSKSVDIRRTLTVLELTVANMSKCVFPLTFFSNRSLGSLSGSVEGVNTLISILDHANNLLSRIIATSLNEETLGFLRYGTLIPSLLPSILLYCTTFVKRGVDLTPLSTPLKLLIHNLQLIGKFELNAARSKAVEKKQVTFSPTPTKDKEFHNESFHGSPATEAKDEEINDASAEEILYMKREQHQISWWFRLLRLAVALSGKMVTLDTRKLRDTFSPASAHFGDIWDKMAKGHFDKTVLYSMLTHSAWRHLRWSTEIADKLSNEIWLQEQLTVDVQSTRASGKVIELCQLYRSKEKTLDSVYNMLSKSSQSMFSVNLLNSIEENLFECVSMGQETDLEYKSKLERNFKLVSSVIKYIYSRRSALVTNCGGLSWVEILLVINNVVRVLCYFVRRSVTNLLLYHPLQLPFKSVNQSRSRRLWRKALLVVLCVQRWCNCLLHGYRKLEHDIVDLVLSVVKGVTDDLTVIPKEEVIATRLSVVFDSLKQCSTLTKQAAQGMSNVAELLDSINSITIRSDIVNSVAVSMKDLVDIQEMNQVNLHRSWLSHSMFASDAQSMKALVASSRQIEGAVLRNLKSFLHTTSCTQIELQFAAAGTRLLEILFLLKPLHLLHGDGFTLNLATKLQIFLHDKYATWNNASEERTAAARKGGSVRDRNFALKKCIFSLLSYSQAYAMRLLSPFLSTSRSLHEVLQSNLQLVTYLQSIRYLETQQRFAEEYSMITGTMKAEENKETSSPFSFPTSLLPLLPSNLSFTSKSKDNLSSGKKRFQDIVMKPMEFSRNTEGMVLQGDKLMNSLKGTDFSIATWIYLKGRSNMAKTVLLFGRINHNEAWPLVLLKPDGKLEIAFGTNNEIERIVSEESLPVFSWSHVAIAVEAKKIKLFINGTLDPQVANTKGNSRAYSFPLVIGGCPSSFRTRISNVREGFDGMLAQCKYYSKPLSPIHVRVIFDNGPPETIDISAKVVYHLLATTKALLLTIDMEYADDLIHRIADVSHTIFVTDISKRNRLAALDLLQVILQKDCLHDLTLTGLKYNADDGKLFTKVQLMTSSVCGDYLTFHSRMVCYLLRLAGWCWMPYVSIVDQPANVQGILDDISTYAPLFSSTRRSNIGIVNDSSMEERVGFQFYNEGELSFHAINILHTLLASEKWHSASIQVVQTMLKSFAVAVAEKNTPNALQFMEVLSCALLLGGVSSGGYLGSVVNTTFDDNEGRIVNINVAANNATVLSNKRNSNDLKAVKVRLSDLQFDDNHRSFAVSSLFNAVYCDVWNVIIALSPRISLLGKDFLSKLHPDSTFQQKSLLKYLRPVESLVFYKLLLAVNQINPSSDVHGRLKDLPLQQSLVSFLIPLASGSVELDCHFTEAKEGASNGCSYTALSPVTKLWFGSLKYLESVSDKVISLRFPAESEERVFVEFVSKHLGISLDQEHKEVLNNSGLWGQSLSWLTVNKCMEASMPAFPQPDYLVSEKALVSTSMGSQNNALDMMLTEQESSRALQLLHYIRYFIVKESRKLLQALTWTSGLLNIPSDTMLWINTCPQGVADKEWVIAENIVDVFNKELLWNRVCSRITTESMTEHFTTLLSTMIRYSGLCFLQSSFYTDKDNLLHSMDFFPAFVRNLLCWVEYNDQSSEFECIAVTVLDILLPALPYVESEWLELLLLQICVNTMKKIAVHILNGSRASSVLLELVRNAHFLSLRQIAQEQITKYKNHSFNNISAAAYNYTQLVAHMELIQRRGNTFDSSDVLRVTTGSVKSHTNLLLAKIQSIETLPAKILLIKSTSFEVDLTSCVTTVLSNAQAMEILQLLTGSNGIDPSVAVVEVALGVGPSTTECIFETVYCGTSLKLSQCGLMPDCAYQMKCRAYFGSMPLSWSSIVEFRTEKAVLFTFDSLRCGPDVVLSDDFLTASYTGDDNWSTLLGSRSFSSGVSSWAIRVVQSSTAYIFIGVATSSADLTTFLGGCSNSWGFIGEHALYHNREKVKVYGEAFSTGDIIGVTLDLNQGTLTFCKNGKSLGVAFDKIYGDLYPAVAFYNVGQELQIVTDGFRTSCAHEPIPISPTRLSMDDVGLVNELLLSLYLGKPLSHRLAVLVAEHCNQWCTTIYVRCRAVSQKDIFLATDSPLLKRFGLVVGERVRTYYGVAEVAGSAFNRIWFRVNSKGEVWFFTVQQIQEGRAKKLFTRCTYDAVDNQTTTSTTTQSAAGTASAASASVGTAATGSVPHSGSASGISAATYDAATILDLLDPAKWTEEMDMCLISFYMSQANAANIEAWKMSSDQLFDNFRVLQQGLSRIVMNNSDLLHKWGISGPKRKAVIARLGLFRALNQLLEMYLPFFISDNSSKGFFQSSVIISDDFVPVIETFQDVGRLEYHRFPHQSESSQQEIRNKVSKNTVFESPWPGLTLSWDPITARNVFIQEMWMGPFHSLRRKIFNSLKLKHFFEVIKKSATRALKTDDDYDYPENLPHVKINRLKSFRAREAAELMQVHGEDLLLSSMFCQLYKELRQHGDEKLRISYTHPMDDGQGRSFKIKFEGEGVDDYGGPYREIFQQICIELQLLYPTGNSTSKPDCFLPLLMPAPNWHADGDIGEKYVFMLNPTITSDLKMDLVVFMGQLIGIAIRSRITLDLAFPSFVWKVLVGESLVEKDLASFDKPAFEMIQQLSVLYKQYQEKGQVASEEALEAIRDLTWSATLSHGEIVELVPNGLQRSVLLPSLGDFLTKYVTRRFDENKQALRMLRKGLVSIIPESALSLLNAEDLQHLVCGSKTIDIDRLQSNTEYDDDIAPTDPHIEYFWEVLREFNEVEKSTFLKFVWARPSLPPDGVEFTQKMRVLSTATDETNVKHDQFLPKAHTCFFSINLPKYSTKEVRFHAVCFIIAISFTH